MSFKCNAATEITFKDVAPGLLKTIFVPSPKKIAFLQPSVFQKTEVCGSIEDDVVQ